MFGFFYYQVNIEEQFLLPKYQNQEITIRGKIIEEDRNVLQVNGISERAILYIESDLNYGQLVKITGTPVVPSEPFKSHLKKDKITVSFFDPEIKVTGYQKSFRFYVYQFRRFLQQKIDKGAPFPESAIMKAVLLGDKTEITSQMQQKFSRAGVSHLLAVSGTHIVIISGLLVAFFGFFTKKYNKWLSLLFLFFFIILVGAPPSAIRAGFMGLILIFSETLGRKKSSLRTLTFIAFLMILFNPLYIWSDIGFQFSFLATLGIILFANKIEKIITSQSTNKIINSFKNSFLKFSFISKTLSVTLSAQVFVFPLGYFYFGSVPLISPVSNIFLAPLLPVLMISGIFSIFLSLFFWESLSFYLSFLVAKLILILVEIFHNFGFLW